MTKFKFLTKFKYAIGILSMTLFLIFAACVKEVVHNQSQFEAEKAELLKAAEEMLEAHGARCIAAFIAEAAEVYEARGLFNRRF